jgi:peptide/nickel transport system substrate-binding protein
MSGDDQTRRLVNDYLQRRIGRRQFLERAAGLGFSLSAASALLAACGGGDEEGAPAATGAKGAATASGPLRLRLLNDIINLDPAFYPALADEVAMLGVYEGLVRYTPGTWKVENQLAESFEPSPDGLRFDFKLKEGIQFHGGYGEVTAEDVKFSYERIAGLTSPKLDSPYKGDWAPHLQEVQTSGKYEGTIILKEQFAPLMLTTLPVNGGLVLSKKAVEEKGKKYATSPIGTGPYEFVEWRPKRDVRLKRFADYGGASADTTGTIWDELVLIPIEEDEAASIALETGEIDSGQLPLASIDRFEENDEFTVEKRTALDYTWIGMNTRSPKLEDINVRQAIRYAIDVPSILEAAFEGRWQRATAIIPPGMPIGYWKDAPVYERDLDKANQFLSQASNPPTELDFRLTEETGAKETGEIVQANLSEIGIDVKLHQLDSSAYYALEKDEMRSRDLFFVGFVTQPDPSWSTVWFVCDQIDVWNWMYWCNKDYDRLHYTALKEPDQAKRNDMYIEMQMLWDAAVHSIWLAWPTNYFGAREGVQPGLRPDGHFVPTAFTAV